MSTRAAGPSGGHGAIRIYCAGSYTFRNKGDAALMLAQLDELRRIHPDALMTVASDTPALDARHYPARVEPQLYGRLLEPERVRDPNAWDRVVSYVAWRIGTLKRRLPHRDERAAIRPQTERGHRSAAAERRALVAFLAFLARMRLAIACGPRVALRAVPPSRRASLRALIDADCAVFAPGGYLMAPHAGHVHWHRHLAALFAARWLGKPVAFLPVTLGPFEGRINRMLARAALDGADLVCVRESGSVGELRRLGVTRPRIVVTTDLAFLVQPRVTDAVRAHLAAAQAAGPGPRVGISVRHHAFRRTNDAERGMQAYVAAMAALVRHVVVDLAGSVVFVPQVTGEAPADDVAVARRVLATAGVDAPRARVIDDADLSPSELCALYGACDAFVGVRMHACIFALAAGVPTLAIAYEAKTPGIMRQLDLGRCVLDIHALEAGELAAALDALLEDKDRLRAHIAGRVAGLRAEARRAASEVGRFIGGADIAEPLGRPSEA